MGGERYYLLGYHSFLVWFPKSGGHNTGSGKVSPPKPDARVKLNGAAQVGPGRRSVPRGTVKRRPTSQLAPNPCTVEGPSTDHSSAARLGTVTISLSDTPEKQTTSQGHQSEPDEAACQLKQRRDLTVELCDHILISDPSAKVEPCLHSYSLV